MNDTSNITIARQRKKKTFRTIDVALLFFSFSSLLYNVEQFQIVGYVLLISSILFLSKILLVNHRFDISRSTFYTILTFLTGYFVWEMSRGVSFRSIEVFVCYIISLIVLHVFASIDICNINKLCLKYYFLIEFVVLLISVLYGGAYNPIDGGFRSIFTTTTFLGLFSCLQIEICVLLYFSSHNKLYLFFIFLFFAIIWMTKVRTAYACVSLILIASFFHSITLKLRNSFYLILKWLFFCGIATIILLYPQLESFDWFDTASDMVYTHTGKILMSGRNVVWAEGFIYISQSPLFGHGLDTISMDISMHSSYLQLILESGAFGLFGLFLLINCIINQILNNKGNIYKLIFFFSLVNLLMATTEVMLLHGQMVLQIIVWMMFGLGLNRKLTSFKL